MNIQMNKKPAEMTFSEFADAMKPSGAVNRFPAIGVGDDVYSYSVYMNGPMTRALPDHVLESTYKDVMLHALTEKLALNPASARDNLKVAEIVSVRSAWMSAVLESSTEIKPSPEIVHDYELLTKGLSHPWIVEQLNVQRALLSKLQPALAMAGVGKDVLPKNVSVGKVVAQDSNFTFQKTSDGEVVTHENRRLGAVPALNSDVSVLYYRGVGQVVSSLDKLVVSKPFIDAESKDLAVTVQDGVGIDQVVLFNSVTSFGNFIKAHGLSPDLMVEAMDVRKAWPKSPMVVASRELTKFPYIDDKSGCLAIGYKESNRDYTALFKSIDDMSSLAKEFNLGTKAIALAELVMSGLNANVSHEAFVQSMADRIEESEREIFIKTDALGYSNLSDPVKGMTYSGKIIAESSMHVAHHVGRGAIVIYDLRTLDKVPAIDDVVSIKFNGDRGVVNNLGKSSVGVGR